MSAQPFLDFAHTPRAESNRQRKAHRLAGAAKALGARPYELAVVGGRPGVEERRARVRRLAQVQQASEETWALAMGQLEGMERWVCGTDQCPRCGWPVKPVRTERGRAILLDPFPHELGTVLPIPGPDGATRARVITASAPRPDDEPLYRQHAASCPGPASTLYADPEQAPTAPQAAAEAPPEAAEAPSCTACGNPLDPELARREPHHSTHPACPEGGAP